MDLLKTILVYMSLVFTTSVQTAPEPSYIPEITPEPTPYVQAATATPVPTTTPTPVPTINITPNPAYKTVQMGDNGDKVRQMQEKLAEYGYYTGEIDGRFGNGTRRAVEAFQYQHGLSVDGIAGRHTLTVLYESTEIRMAPSEEPTPEPTAEMQLSIAITPQPTAEPVAEPTEAPVKTAEPTVEPTAEPTAEPVKEPVQEKQPLEAMDGWIIRVEPTGDTAASKKGETLTPYLCGEELYLPLSEVLAAGSVNVISSSSLEMDEFAFAMGDAIIRIAYTENQNGEPDQVEAFINGEPQIMPVRDIRRAGETIYLPASSIGRLTGITAELDEAQKCVIVTVPVAVEE